MNAREEIDKLVAVGDIEYAAATNNIERARITGKTALVGLELLAERIDAITHRLDRGLGVGEEAVDVRAELADLRREVRKLEKALKKATK